MSLKLWYVSGQFYNLALVLFTFVQNIGNLPKFNFQTGNLARGAGIIWTRWKSRTFVNVGGSRICSQGACSGNDGGSLIWECTWRHLAARMLARPCLLYGALMGGVRGGEFSTLFSTLVRTTGLQLWSRHNKAQMERFAKSISCSRLRWALWAKSLDNRCKGCD